jgi:hypothetical protein
MTLTPRWRKAALLVHVTSSVGWMGAVAAYLALALGGLRSRDPEVARSAYISMELVGWTVIVPLSFLTLLSGLVESLGTEWGLFRHYWVAVKFLIASVGSIVLLVHMRVVGQMSELARRSLAPGEFGGPRVQLVVHATGGLLLLVAATVLSIFKPWGMTPYGRRREAVIATGIPAEAPLSVRGIFIFLGFAGFILTLLLVHHLMGGGLRHH